MGVVVFCSLLNPPILPKKGRVGLAKLKLLKLKYQLI